jgi:ligand-binding sensor domain-containing protein
MQVGFRSLNVRLVVAAVALAVGYTLGVKKSDSVAVVPNAKPSGATSPVPSAQVQQQKPALPANHPSSAQMAASGASEVVEREGKVEVPRDVKFVHFRVGNRNVKDILCDEKTIWVGTSGGVIRYDTTTDKFRLFDTKNGLLSNGIFHVNKLDGRILVGTYGGGMALYDEAKDSWESFNIAEGLADAFVYDTLKLKNGDLWIATWSGANRVRGGALRKREQWDLFTVENTKGGLPNDWVYALAEGKNGEVWLATEGGLARFQSEKWTQWNHDKGLGADYEIVKNDLQFKNDPAQYSQHHARQKEEMGLQGVNVAYNPNYIVSLAVDRDGVVWAGTWGGGLSRFDGTKWKSYTVRDGLPGNHVFMLHTDPKGILWIGTNAGLARFEGDRFKVITTSEGLFSNTVFSMSSSLGDGSQWVGSYGGVAHLISAPQ